MQEDPCSISGSGRFPGEGIGSPVLWSWVSLVAPQVRNPPAMWVDQVGSLDWEDPLEKGKAIYPLQYSGLKNSMDYCIVHRGHKESDTTERFYLHLHSV